MVVKHELWVYQYVNRLMQRAPDLAPDLTALFEWEIHDDAEFRRVIRECRDTGIYREVRALLVQLAAEFSTGQYASDRIQWPN